MGVKWTTKKDGFPSMKASIKGLDKKKVNVGVLGGENAWLAGIHEYGVNIRAKKKYLTVPLIPEAAGRKASSFGDLFVFTSKKGNKFLARKKGKKEIELVYWLTPSVVIPPRPFLSAGFDEHSKEVLKKAERLLPGVLDGAMRVEQYCESIGLLLASKIKDYARDLKNPPNSNITKNVKGDDNPLVDTGKMIESITYEVE